MKPLFLVMVVVVSVCARSKKELTAEINTQRETAKQTQHTIDSLQMELRNVNENYGRDAKEFVLQETILEHCRIGAQYANGTIKHQQEKIDSLVRRCDTLETEVADEKIRID